MRLVFDVFKSEKELPHACHLRMLFFRFSALRENARYIPKSSFLMRRHYFNNEESGVLKTQLVRGHPIMTSRS